MAKGKEANGSKLYRVAKFEIFPTQEQQEVLAKVSANLTIVWNSALAERQAKFDEYIAPLYVELRELDRKSEEAKKLREEIRKAYKEHPMPTLFDQINQLTPRRQSDPDFSSVPRNWQEETLDALNGSFLSFMSLRKNGDIDARVPGPRWPDRCEISGRSGFKLLEGIFILSCKETKLWFPVPDYQLAQLSTAVQLKKFTLYSREDQKKGTRCFWASIAYEIPIPKQQRFVPDNAIYIALGASSIGVLLPSGEERIIDFWRPDKHWKPEISTAESRMRTCQTGSRAWKRRNRARRLMNTTMSRQQKQNHREVVAKLLQLGNHFVITEYKIRSKPDKLADSTKPERGGAPQGLNWSAQNTGSLGEFVLWLKQKTKEKGGTVQIVSLALDSSQVPDEKGRENKIAITHLLRDYFLRSLTATSSSRSY